VNPRTLVFLAVVPLLTGPCLFAQCGDQGVWTQPLTFPYASGAIDNPLLLTDGRVMVQYVGTNPGNHQFQDWYALTPDNTAVTQAQQLGVMPRGQSWLPFTTLNRPMVLQTALLRLF
jgi:hypothetical protein